MERQCWGCLAAEDEKMLARVVPANEAVRGKMGRGYNGKMIWCIITGRRDQRRHTTVYFMMKYGIGVNVERVLKLFLTGM
jgi:hypothetical protein